MTINLLHGNDKCVGGMLKLFAKLNNIFEPFLIRIIF